MGTQCIWWDHKPVLLRQPEDGQYGPKHVVVHLAIKYTYVTQLCLTIYNFQVPVLRGVRSADLPASLGLSCSLFLSSCYKLGEGKEKSCWIFLIFRKICLSGTVAYNSISQPGVNELRLLYGRGPQIMKRERKPTKCNHQMFIINTVSTCFGHHYAHLQENKDRVLLHSNSNLHSARTLQRSAPQPLLTTSSRTSTAHHMQ